MKPPMDGAGRSESGDQPDEAPRLAEVLARSSLLPGNFQFLVIARLSNFAILRRHVGIARANLLATDVATRIAALLPDASLSIVSRERIEVTFDGPDRAMLDAALKAIDIAFDTPFDIDGEPYSVELLLAASICPTAECDDVRMIDEAECALEDAAQSGGLVVRAMGQSTAAFDQADLARGLRAAIGRGELFLQYQPKAHVRRQEIASVEALIRWQHPTRGLVYPGEFIPIAEESRDIVDLTVWTIEQAIRDQRIMRAHGHDIVVFVNISARLLSDARFVRKACAIVEQSGARLGFEITETAIISDPVSAIAHLHRFASIGVTVSIDDYGAGLSSLAYLKQLPARELKIDKLFVTKLTSSNRDPLIVRSTIDLAHAMEMEVVAEGVETPAALALLTVMGCDVVQGFLISRPIGLPALLKFLDAGLSTQLAVKPPSFGFAIAGNQR